MVKVRVQAATAALVVATITASGSAALGASAARAAGTSATIPPGEGTPPAGVTTARAAGSTAAIVVASRADVAPGLLTPATLKALGIRFTNSVGSPGRVVPLPVLLVGSAGTPTIKAALATLRQTRPARLYLLGMTHDQRLTLVNNTIFDGVTIYINKQPRKAATLSVLVGDIAGAAHFAPVFARRGTGLSLANANAVDASTPLQPYWPWYQGLPHSAMLDTNLLPPVANQGQEQSCVGFSTSYYYKTYQEAREHHWDVKSDYSHQFSPAFIYNQINGGRDNGSYIADALSTLTQQGDVPLSVFPYQEGAYATWSAPPQDVLNAASAYKAGGGFGYINLYPSRNTYPYGNTDSGISTLKKWLVNKDGFVIAATVDSAFQGYTGGVYDGDVQSSRSVGGHAMMVVGYDDNAEGTGIGAFRVINSWGTTWGEQGYGWLSYNYFKKYVGQAWAMYDSTGDATPTVVTSAYPGSTTTLPPAGNYQTPAQTVYSTDQSWYAASPSTRYRNWYVVSLHFILRGTRNGAEVERHQYDYNVWQQANVTQTWTLKRTANDGTAVSISIAASTGRYPY